MPSFVILGNLTEQGVSDVKGMPDRLQAAKDAIQEAGGRMILYYLTMGQYDFVTVVEAPDAETATQLLLGDRRPGERAYDDDVCLYGGGGGHDHRVVAVACAGRAAR